MRLAPAPVAGSDVEGGGTDRATSTSLWRHRDFLYFWSGQSVSALGSAVTFVALPLVGVLLLDLRALQVGVLVTASSLPNVIIGPFVGPIVDRLNRRRMLIASDVGRALLIGSVPLAAMAHVLTFAHLIVVGAGLSALTLLFTVAHQAFLPRVIPARSLADGNGKLEASQSAAEVGGPGLAGWLIGLGGPAVVLLVDAGSYFVSAWCLNRLRIGDARTAPTGRGPVIARFWADTRSGFGLLWRDTVLRSMALSYATLALFAQAQSAVYVLFLVRDIHFSPLVIGVVFSLSSVVGLGSALLGGRVAHRLGVGRLVVLGQAATVAGGVLLAAVGGSTLQAAATMLFAEAFFAAGMSLYGVGSRTLIQSRTTDDVRGRVVGASRVLTSVLVAAAGLVGGGIGATFGLRATLVVGGIGMVLALGLVFRRHVWRVDAPGGRETPQDGATRTPNDRNIHPS